MTAHTPGPWLFINDWPDMRIESADGKRVIADYDTSFIEYPDDDENEAKARLIAAAPELLEALVHAREWVREYMSTYDIPEDDADTDVCVALRSANAAIAKAKGEMEVNHGR